MQLAVRKLRGAGLAHSGGHPAELVRWLRSLVSVSLSACVVSFPRAARAHRGAPGYVLAGLAVALATPTAILASLVSYQLPRVTRATGASTKQANGGEGEDEGAKAGLLNATSEQDEKGSYQPPSLPSSSPSAASRLAPAAGNN